MKYQSEELYFKIEPWLSKWRIWGGDPTVQSVDQVCGEMVIQRKMEVIYSERDPRSAFKCEDVKVANILLCHGRQYKYWYIL